MLKLELGKGKDGYIEASGNPVRVAAEIGCVCKAIYQALDGVERACFKEMMQRIVGDEESPMWKLDQEGEDGIKAIGIKFPFFRGGEND